MGKAEITYADSIDEPVTVAAPTLAGPKSALVTNPLAL